MSGQSDTKWMCWRCGYFMDASWNVSVEGVPPRENDLSLCMNCAAVYVRHGANWQPISETELASLNAHERAMLARVKHAVETTVKTNLAAKQGGKA